MSSLFNALGIQSSREAKEKDDPVVNAFSLDSYFAYEDDPPVCQSFGGLQNNMPLDTHKLVEEFLLR